MKKIMLTSIMLLFCSASLAETKPVCDTKLQKLKPACNIGKVFQGMKKFSSKNKTLGESFDNVEKKVKDVIKWI